MEKVERLVQQVRAYRDSCSNSRERSRCLTAEIHLDHFRTHLEKWLEQRELRLRRAALRVNYEEGRDADIPEPTMPQLIFNNQPILRLFLYRLRTRMNREQLVSWLSACGLSRFTVGRVGFRDGFTHGIIECEDIGSSAHLQVLALTNQLSVNWRDPGPEGAEKVCYARVRPDQSTPLEPGVSLPTMSLPQRAFSHVVGPVFLNADLVSLICASLSFRDFMNFHDACYGMKIFRELPLGLHFDASEPRYHGGDFISLIKRDFVKFRFISIKVAQVDRRLDASIVRFMLDSQSQRRFVRRVNGKVPLSLVDLSSVDVTPALIELLRANFNVKHLRLAGSRSHLGGELACTELETLELAGTSLNSTTVFAAEQLPWLKIVRLDACKKISAESIIGLISKHPSLDEVSLTNCTFREEAWNAANILLATLRSKISRFIFKYSHLSHVIPFEYQPELFVSESLIYLDLSGNQLFTDVVNEIAQRTPALRHLNIQGVWTRTALNLAALTQLESLHISYDHTLDHTLQSLVNTASLHTIEIDNNYGRKKTRALELAFLNRFLDVAQSVRLHCTKCKLVLPAQVRRKLQQRNARVDYGKDEFTISMGA